jgi:hypothetical protein
MGAMSSFCAHAYSDCRMYVNRSVDCQLTIAFTIVNFFVRLVCDIACLVCTLCDSIALYCNFSLRT